MPLQCLHDAFIIVLLWLHNGFITSLLCLNYAFIMSTLCLHYAFITSINIYIALSLESSRCGALLEASRCHDKDDVVDGVVVQDKDDMRV